MSGAALVRSGVLCGLAAVALAATVAWTLPRVRASGAVRDEVEGEQLPDLSIRAAGLSRSTPAAWSARAQDALRAERSAQQLAQMLGAREPFLGGGAAADRTRLLEELVAKTSKPRAVVESMLPPADLDAEESAFRCTTVRDLSAALIDAGAADLIFFLFPPESDPDASARLGRWLPTRLVTVEYEAGVRSHAAFLQKLLQRRERGPFYLLESVKVRPAEKALRAAMQTPVSVEDHSSRVVATVTLRRVRPTPAETR